jgi:Putative DNA-binding domain
MSSEKFSLKDMQHWMQGMVMQVPGNHHDVLPETLVHATTRLSAARHLSIYQGSYIARLRECMQNQFSALSYALGPQLFEAFADEYLATHPSDSYTLNTLGEKFPVFLATTRPDAQEAQQEDWPDFMIELAAFEYGLSLIFDEPEKPCGEWATATTPDQDLQLLPIFHLFHHRFPVCAYYLAFQQQQQPELPFPEETYAVVTRYQYRLGLFVVRPAQYYWLQKMHAGRSVGEAWEEMINEYQFDREQVKKVWPEWRSYFIASGFFALR